VRGLGETVEKQMAGIKTMNHHLLRNGIDKPLMLSLANLAL
jgi:hypothetical protein